MQLHVFTNMSISNQYTDTYYPNYMASNESIKFYISDYIEHFFNNLPGAILSRIPFLPLALLGQLMQSYSMMQWVNNMLHKLVLSITARDIKTQLLPEISRILSAQTYANERERKEIERATGMRIFIEEIEEYAANEPDKNCTFVIMRRMDYMDSTLWKSNAVLYIFNSESATQRKNALILLLEAFANFIFIYAQKQGKVIERLPTLSDVMPYAKQLKEKVPAQSNPEV